MVAAPLSLALAAKKPRFAFGEGVLLELRHRVDAPLRLETVELNADRTRIDLRGPDGAVRTLTGADHRALFGLTDEDPIGRAFDAKAGASWTSLVELLAYRSPLAPGAYAAAVSYRWGASEDDRVRTEEVPFEVVPAETRGVATRWLVGTSPRATLAGVRVASVGGEARWLYQLQSAGAPPDRLTAAVDLGPAPADAEPALAHRNDIAAMRYERWVTWAEPGALGWLQCGLRGKTRGPGRAPHGLDPSPPPRLVDAPLHTRAGRLVALLEGQRDGAPARVIVEVDLDGTARSTWVDGQRLERSVVCWSADDPVGTVLGLAPTREGRLQAVRLDLPRGTAQALGEVEGELLALTVEPWHTRAGAAAVLGAPGDEPGTTDLRVVALAPDAPPRHVRTHRVEGPFDLAAAEALPGGRDVIALGRCAAGWLVLGPPGRAVVPSREGERRPPLLVVPELDDRDQARAWLVRWSPDRLEAAPVAWER